MRRRRRPTSGSRKTCWRLGLQELPSGGSVRCWQRRHRPPPPACPAQRRSAPLLRALLSRCSHNDGNVPV